MICAPGTDVRLAPSPETYVNTPPVALTFPESAFAVTANDVNVPTDVMFGCAIVVRLPASSVPVTLPEAVTVTA